MPEKFDLSYVGEDNQKHRPVVIHRAVYGSIDRFIGILTEHFAGSFPLWLSPIQARVIPVSQLYEAYSNEVTEKLLRAGVRVEADNRNEKLGYKIREAQLEKIPYMLVVGENEMKAGTVSVRKRGEGDLGAQSIEQAGSLIISEIQSKK